MTTEARGRLGIAGMVRRRIQQHHRLDRLRARASLARAAQPLRASGAARRCRDVYRFWMEPALTAPGSASRRPGCTRSSHRADARRDPVRVRPVREHLALDGDAAQRRRVRIRDWMGPAARAVVVGWWWVGFLLLLGPIALGRIDSVTVPIAMVGGAPRGDPAARRRGAARDRRLDQDLAGRRSCLRRSSPCGSAGGCWCRCGDRPAWSSRSSLVLGSGVERARLHHRADGSRAAGRGAGEHDLAVAGARWASRHLRVLRRGHPDLPGRRRWHAIAAALMTPLLGVAVRGDRGARRALAARRGVAAGRPAAAARARPGRRAHRLQQGGVAAVRELARRADRARASRRGSPAHGRSFRMPAALVLAIAGPHPVHLPVPLRALLVLDPFMLVVLTRAQRAVLRAAGLGGARDRHRADGRITTTRPGGRRVAARDHP